MSEREDKQVDTCFGRFKVLLDRAHAVLLPANARCKMSSFSTWGLEFAPTVFYFLLNHSY
jgi:hypothetical protein